MSHQHNTRHATQNTVTLNQNETTVYYALPIKHQSTVIWNQINSEARSDLIEKSTSKIKEYITNMLISNYLNNSNNNNQLGHILHYQI